MGKNIGEGLRLLILDDERVVCRFAKEFFERRGFEVLTASAGKSAIMTAKKAKPHIALLDIHLGASSISGLDALKFIRQNNPECFCIMVTYDDKEENILQAKELGAFDYLTKPLLLPQMEKIIGKAVKKMQKGAH